MRSPSDQTLNAGPPSPVTRWNRRRRAALVLASPAIAISAVWGYWPIPRPAAIDPTLTRPQQESKPDEAHAPLDREAFAAAIWNPEPAPPRAAEPTPTPRPPRPIQLQLIGIARDPGPDGNEVLRAALYDPDTDKLHIVAAGERVGDVTIVAVEPELVRLETGGRPAELRLREDREGAL